MFPSSFTDRMLFAKQSLTLVFTCYICMTLPGSVVLEDYITNYLCLTLKKKQLTFSKFHLQAVRLSLILTGIWWYRFLLLLEIQVLYWSEQEFPSINAVSGL